MSGEVDTGFSLILSVLDTFENLTLISQCCLPLSALTEDDTELLCAACAQLHRTLEEENLLGKKFRRRTPLLKALYKLVDVGSDPLSLKLAKLILAVSFPSLWCYRL